MLAVLLGALILVLLLAVVVLYNRVCALEKSLTAGGGVANSPSELASAPPPASQPDKAAVDVSTLTAVRPLAAGSTAAVWLANDASGACFALKVMPKTETMPPAPHDKTTSSKQPPPPAAEAVAAERRALAAVGGHPLVASCAGAFHDAQNVYLALDLAPGGDLHRLLHTATPEGRLPAHHARVYAASLAGALGHVHAMGYVHGGVSLENILLAADGTVRLADFSNARPISAPAEQKTAAAAQAAPASGLAADIQTVLAHLLGRGDGSVDAPRGPSSTPDSYPYMAGGPYTAPELFLAPSSAETDHTKTAASLRIAPALDYWALGVLTHEMLTGRPPFEAPSLPELSRAVHAYAAGGAEAAATLMAELLEDANAPPGAGTPTLEDERAAADGRFLSVDGAKFVTGLLAPTPDSRLGGDTLVAHPWMACGQGAHQPALDVAALQAGTALPPLAAGMLVPGADAVAPVDDDAEDELMTALFDGKRGVMRNRAPLGPLAQTGFEAALGMPPLPTLLFHKHNAVGRPGAERLGFVKLEHLEIAGAVPPSPASVYGTPCGTPLPTSKTTSLLGAGGLASTPISTCALAAAGTGKTMPADDPASLFGVDASPRTDARRRTGRTSRLRRRGNIQSRESRESRDSECAY